MVGMTIIMHGELKVRLWWWCELGDKRGLWCVFNGNWSWAKTMRWQMQSGGRGCVAS